MRAPLRTLGRFPRSRPRLTIGLVVAALALAATSVGVGFVVAAAPDRCEQFATDARQRWQTSIAAATDRADGAQRILVIGDSYSMGLGVRPEEAWPARLPGRVLVDGFSGSGFSELASECGDLSYASRAGDTLTEVADIDLVIVEGGLNDADQPTEEIEAGVRRLFDVLGERPVLVVGPPPAPSRSATVPIVDEMLNRLTEELGGSYLSMAEEEFDYLDDRLHLTPAGHAEFGDLVAGRVTAAD